MKHPFPKSTPVAEKLKRLMKQVGPEDTVGILINADPDAMSSALALQRLFWRRVKKTAVFRTNVIKRADNLAMIKLLNIKQQHIRKLNPARISRWAIVDSQRRTPRFGLPGRRRPGAEADVHHPRTRRQVTKG